MNEYFIDLGFSILFTLLRLTVKNQKSREQMQKVFQKLYLQILISYPEFAEDERILDRVEQRILALKVEQTRELQTDPIEAEVNSKLSPKTFNPALGD